LRSRRAFPEETASGPVCRPGAGRVTPRAVPADAAEIPERPVRGPWAADRWPAPARSCGRRRTCRRQRAEPRVSAPPPPRSRPPERSHDRCRVNPGAWSPVPCTGTGSAASQYRGLPAPRLAPPERDGASLRRLHAPARSQRAPDRAPAAALRRGVHHRQ
jgi:hypothetical protein